MKRLIAGCFVAVAPETGTIAGYYTLAAASVPAAELPTETLKRLPRYPVLPAALVGRLAIDQAFHGKGLGSALLADAALRSLNGDLKAFAIIADAKDDSASAFYRHHGFRSFSNRPMSLFRPSATARKGAAETSAVP